MPRHLRRNRRATSKRTQLRARVVCTCVRVMSKDMKDNGRGKVHCVDIVLAGRKSRFVETKHVCRSAVTRHVTTNGAATCAERRRRRKRIEVTDPHDPHVSRADVGLHVNGPRQGGTARADGVVHGGLKTHRKYETESRPDFRDLILTPVNSNVIVFGSRMRVRFCWHNEPQRTGQRVREVLNNWGTCTESEVRDPGRCAQQHHRLHSAVVLTFCRSVFLSFVVNSTDRVDALFARERSSHQKG